MIDSTRKHVLRQALFNWSTFHPLVATLNVEEVDFLLATEESHKNRKSFIARLNCRKRRLMVEQVRQKC